MNHCQLQLSICSTKIENSSSMTTQVHLIKYPMPGWTLLSILRRQHLVYGQISVEIEIEVTF